MIVVRPYRKEDESIADALYKASGNYGKFNFPHDHLLPCSAVVSEDGKITNVAILRRTAELYYITAPHLTKRERLGRIMMLQNSLVPELRKADIGELHGWVPQDAADSISAHKTMLRLGWRKPLWACYALSIE